MAIDLTQAYPQQVDAATAAYPLGKARNVTSIDDNNATPLDENWMNDHFGFQQALLARAGIVPSGTPDTATASQYLDAVEFMVASGAQSYVVDAATGIPSSNIPDSEASVVSRSFDNMGAGGATYRRSSAAAVEGYPALSWFQSADGAYWLLDELEPTPEMFGATPASSMDKLTHEGAADSTPAIKDARQYALKRKVGVYIKRYYRWVGSLVLADNERLIGSGRYSCGIQTMTDGSKYEAGMQVLNDGNQITGMELQAYLSVAKLSGGGTGMVGCSLVVGNYFDGTIPTPKNYYIDDLLLTRKDNETGHTSYTGIALQVSGGSNYGYLGYIEIATRHSVAYMSHWNGNGETPVGSTPTSTVHPRYFTIDKLVVTDHIDTLMTLSSAASINIRSVYAESCANALTVLAGDEGDELNVGEPNVGAGIHIGDLTVNNLVAKGKESFIHGAAFTSLATSKSRTIDGLDYQSQLRQSIVIDVLTLNSNDPQIENGLNIFYYYGLLHINRARLTGFKYALRCAKSRGDIKINLEHTDGACVVKNSDIEISGSMSLKDRFAVPNTNTWCALVDDDVFEVGIFGFLRNATELESRVALPERIEIGGTVEITGIINGKEQTVSYIAKKFVPKGVTTIDIGVEFQNNANTTSLKYVGRSKVSFDMDEMVGGVTGVYAKSGHIKVKGALSCGRYNVYAMSENAIVEYEISTSVSGDYRLEGLTTSLYDVFLEAGATAIVSGVLGAGKLADTGVHRNIGGDVNKIVKHNVVIKDAIIYDNSNIIAIEAHKINCSVYSSIYSTGEEYNIVDAYGLEKSGQTDDGSFVRRPDGSMECWIRNKPFGDVHPMIWDFPATFAQVGSTYVNGTGTRWGSSETCNALAVSGKNAEVMLYDNAGVAAVGSRGVSLHAIGFWKVPT